MNRNHVAPAAEVRAAEDLATLAGEINQHHEAGQKTQEEMLRHYRAAGEGLLKAKARCEHGEWLKWLKKNIRCSQRQAYRYIEFASKVAVTATLEAQQEALRRIQDNESPEDEPEDDPAEPVQPASRPSQHSPGAKAADFPCGVCGEIFTQDVWHCQGCDAHWPRTKDVCDNCPMPADVPPPDPPAAPRLGKPGEYVTLEEWNSWDKSRKQRFWEVIHDVASGSKALNYQDGESIEWSLWSWNPVTGCLHNCPYCYARDIANRIYEPKFNPSFWPGRLDAPLNVRLPEDKIAAALAEKTTAGDARAMGLKNIFVCSMADLFGRWVPAEWIEAVLRTVRKSTQWNFLFLTKFPIRMAEFDFPVNAWVGTTVDCQARVANAEKAFRKVKAGVKWLSCEPLIEPLKFQDLGVFNWVVIGGSSKSTQTPEWHPPRRWINDLEQAAGKAGCKVYEKTNLLERVRQYPGVDSDEADQAPEKLRYLPTDR